VSQSDNEESKTQKPTKAVPSVSNAIMDILNNETKNEDCPILSRNYRPFKLLEKERKEIKDKKDRMVQSEQKRLQGRLFPTKDDNEYEKSLQMIATKGVVRLFNAVSHQQTEIKRDHIKDEQLRKEFVSKRLELDKSKVNSNDTIVKKIMATEKKWKVFEDDSEENEKKED